MDQSLSEENVSNIDNHTRILIDPPGINEESVLTINQESGSIILTPTQNNSQPLQSVVPSTPNNNNTTTSGNLTPTGSKAGQQSKPRQILEENNGNYIFINF